MFTLLPEKRSPFALAVLVFALTAVSVSAQDIKRGSTETVRSSRGAVGRARAFEVRLKVERRAPPVAAPSLSKAAQEHFKLANGFLEQNNIPKAIGEYKLAIAANNKFADAHYGLGLAHKASLDLDKAIDSWQKAIKYDPNIYQAHAELANAYMTMDRLDDAVAEYKALIASRPNYAEAYFGLGTVLYQLSQFNEAIPNFQKSIELKSNFFPEAHFNLAMIYFSSHDIANAEIQARKAIEQFGSDSPDGADMWFTLGTILYDKSEYENSIQAFQKTLDLCKGCLSDDIARVHYNLSLPYEAMGQKQDAINSIEQVLKLAPSIVDVKALKERLERLRRPERAQSDTGETKAVVSAEARPND
jgi:tetratricopeptide (TPR) repeat protein